MSANVNILQQVTPDFPKAKTVYNWAKLTIRRHRERGFKIGDDVTTEYLEQLMEKAENKPCPICGETTLNFFMNTGSERPSIDVINPLKEFTRDNIWIVCRKCNDLKGHKSIKVPSRSKSKKPVFLKLTRHSDDRLFSWEKKGMQSKKGDSNG